MKKFVVFGQIILIGLFLTGCAQNLSPNSYETQQVNSVSKVEKGSIVSKRIVAIDNNSGVGGAAGVGVGASGGSLIGNNVATNIIGGIGGALVGGLIGNAIDKSIHHQEGYEYIVKLDDGKTISVVQTKENDFAVNQKVLVIMGKNARIVADTTA